MIRSHPRRHVLLTSALGAAAVFCTSSHAQPAPDRPSADAQSAVTEAPRAATAQPPAPDAVVTPLLTRPLVGMAGKEVSMTVVEYAPGGASPPHRHNADVLVYVLEGEVVMQVAGGEEITLTAGQTFYELPTDIHTVSRNASSTEPARFLAFLVKQAGAPATLPAE